MAPLIPGSGSLRCLTISSLRLQKFPTEIQLTSKIAIHHLPPNLNVTPNLVLNFEKILFRRYEVKLSMVKKELNFQQCLLLPSARNDEYCTTVP